MQQQNIYIFELTLLVNESKDKTCVWTGFTKIFTLKRMLAYRTEIHLNVFYQLTRFIFHCGKIILRFQKLVFSLISVDTTWVEFSC